MLYFPKLRLALAQVNPTVGDMEQNASKVIAYIHKAKEWGADLVVFPQMVITGYPPYDLLLRPGFIAKNLEQARRVAVQTKDIGVVYGFVDKRREEIYNAAAFACHGKLVGVHHKSFAVYGEARYDQFIFASEQDWYFTSGKSCPLFTSQQLALGINIGEEIDYPNGPAYQQAISGAQLIVVIDASPYYLGKTSSQQKRLSDRAAECGVFIAYVNMVGGQDELVFDGGSMVFNPQGKLITLGKQFEEDLVVVDLSLDEVFPKDLGQPKKTRYKVEKLEFEFPPSKPKPPIYHQKVIPLDPIAEVYHALVLGTKDYVHKNGFQKVVIGLSGGIDSSLATLIAVDALGAENVTCVSLPSRFSSEESVKDAQKLCQNLGVKLLTLSIEPAFSAFLEILKDQFSGTQFGVAEENIQARSRANILMALANKFGWLVLTTGNKSELATGYATLGGDLMGGFAVLKDIPKTMVYQLARYKNTVSGREIIPQSVLEKPPSAELRPNQKDTDTLPPYEILDPILKAYIEENRSLSEIVAMGFPEETVRRVILMVNRSEYKRRQAPVGIRITPRLLRCLPVTSHFQDF